MTDVVMPVTTDAALKEIKEVSRVEVTEMTTGIVVVAPEVRGIRAIVKTATGDKNHFI
jgi:hypothetical protein